MCSYSNRLIAPDQIPSATPITEESMGFQPIYNRFNDWIQGFSVRQCVLVVWLVAIIVSVPVGVVFAGNTLTTAVTLGIGGATGAASIVYLMER
jgi:hypothetical protein